MNSEERVKEQITNVSYKAGLSLEKSLLKKINGNIVLENLLKNNAQIDNCIFNQRQSLLLILKYKRYDLLKYVTIRNILRKRKGKERFLDYILKEFKNNKSINISAFNPFNGLTSLKDIASTYITYAKYGLEDYLPILDEDVLKQKEKNPILKILSLNKNLLSIMLSKNKEITTNRLLSKRKIKDLDLLLSIKNNSRLKVKIDLQDNCANKYLKEYNESIEGALLALDNDDQLLLKKLCDLLDGRCDKEAINVLLCSYIEQLYAGDRNSTINEIIRLIDILRKDKTFSIVMGSESYFSELSNQICLSSPSISTFNHELGHMLYHKLTNHQESIQFNEIINKIRRNPNTKKNVEILSNFFQKINPLVKKKAEEYYEEEKENLTSDKEIESFLDTKKEELIKQYMLKGYSRKTLETILNRSYTLEEYKEQHKAIQVSSLRNTINDVKFSPITRIADILDAIYKGEFLSGKLKNEFGQCIKPVTGHGLFYYNNSYDVVFDEIFANYCTIRKVVERDITYYKDPIHGEVKDPIDFLRIMVGDELVDYLENFYQKEILKSDKYNVVRSR